MDDLVVLMDEKHPMNPAYTITDSIAAALTQIERARGFLEAATLSEQWIKEMSDRALLLEAHPHHPYRGNSTHDRPIGKAAPG